MKAVIIDQFVKVSVETQKKLTETDLNQNYDEIRVSEVSEPTQKDNEVLVRVEAAGLNFVDLLYVRHQKHSYVVAFFGSLILFFHHTQLCIILEPRGELKSASC